MESGRACAQQAADRDSVGTCSHSRRKSDGGQALATLTSRRALSNEVGFGPDARRQIANLERCVDQRAYVSIISSPAGMIRTVTAPASRVLISRHEPPSVSRTNGARRGRSLAVETTITVGETAA